MRAFKLAILLWVLSAVPASQEGMAQGRQPLSISLEGYDYPYKVDFLPLTLEGQDSHEAQKLSRQSSLTLNLDPWTSNLKLL